MTKTRKITTLNKNKNIDYRTEHEIMEEIIDSILELQDVLNADFPWQMTIGNLIAIDNETIQFIIKTIKKGQRYERRVISKKPE